MQPTSYTIFLLDWIQGYGLKNELVSRYKKIAKEKCCQFVES